MDKTKKILQRIERESGVPDLASNIVDRIGPADLQSLLLEVYKGLIKRRNPRILFSDYVSNRFVRPSLRNPTVVIEWDRVAFSHLPEGFQAVELSPVSPLGTVSLTAPISQDWVLTTIRNTEVVADATNVLALECAVRRNELTRVDPTNATPVRLACSHRVVRAQRYENPDALSHFRLFSLCSAGRDTGNLRFEMDSLSEHIGFYLESIRDFLGSRIPLRVVIADLSADSRYSRPLSGLVSKLRKKFAGVDIVVGKAQEGDTGYYGKYRFHVYASPGRGEEVELADGGDTDWTQKLLNHGKERLMISGIGSERLCEKFVPTRKTSRKGARK